MSALEPVSGHTYRILNAEGVEQTHIHVSRVHGRKIETKVTAWSALMFKSTRLRWRKTMQAVIDAGFTVIEEPTP